MNSTPATSPVLLEEGGAVIGSLRSFPFQKSSLAPEAEDVLVTYLGRAGEAMNPADEEWREGPMMEAIERCLRLGASQTIEYVMAGAEAFAAGAPQHDDMTLGVLRGVARTGSRQRSATGSQQLIRPNRRREAARGHATVGVLRARDRTTAGRALIDDV